MLQYLTGDATYPAFKGNKIICHICNDIGKWGKGFVLSLSKRWLSPRNEYYRWYQDCQSSLPLGEIQLVQVEGAIWVANMIAQRSIYNGSNGSPPIRYDALRSCLVDVCERACLKKASVHMPRIGIGLAGGKWEVIEQIIQEELVDKDVRVYVYDWRK